MNNQNALTPPVGSNVGLRRHYTRFKLDNPLEAAISICQISGALMSPRSSTVQIEFFDKGILHFSSLLIFPISAAYFLRFHICIEDEDYYFYGQVKSLSSEDNRHIHGVQVIELTKNSIRTFGALNEILIQQSSPNAHIHKLYRFMSNYQRH